MTNATCPTCGGACRVIQYQQDSPKWYESLGQAELDAAQDHALSMEKLVESLKIERVAANNQIEELKAVQPCQELREARLKIRTAKARITKLEEQINHMHDDNNATARRTRVAQARIVELEAEKRAHICRFETIRTIRTPDLVIEEPE